MGKWAIGEDNNVERDVSINVDGCGNNRIAHEKCKSGGNVRWIVIVSFPLGDGYRKP